MTRATYDKIKGHAVTQSDVGPNQWRERDESGNWTEWQNITANTDIWYRRSSANFELRNTLAQSDAEPQDVRKLISELRELGELYATDEISDAYPGVGELMLQAAAALAQSDAEIVQWQRRRADDDGWASSWYDCRDDEHLTPKAGGKRDRDGVGFHWEYRPLYASPPTSAGLIEAAEIVETEEEPAAGELPPELIKAVLNGDTVTVERAIIAAVRATKKSIESRIRARATDRSGPRPDASAGLIEAAKEIEKQACRESHFHRAEAFNEAARIIRARAADRSGK